MLKIAKAGIAGASGFVLVRRALREHRVSAELGKGHFTVIAAGKVAGPMASAFVVDAPGLVDAGLVATASPGENIESLEWVQVGHPLPNEESVLAGRKVLDLARHVARDERLVVLLSGGASAGLSVPVPGLTLREKIEATQSLLRGGVAIDAVNCVRKHLSVLKGGWLGAAVSGSVVTLAISDVVAPVADDPTVIGSGLTAGDPTTFADALEVVNAPAVRTRFPETARRILEEGLCGKREETPKPDDKRLKHSKFRVIGSRLDALRSAAQEAVNLGYYVITIPDPVVGEARFAGAGYLNHVLGLTRQSGKLLGPVCVLSAGETTVEVAGSGHGGRNQEFVLAAAQMLSGWSHDTVLASIGTDGIDGPTDAAGAMVDTTTLQRARERGLAAPGHYLDRNDSYAFFDHLGDLVRLGPTQTNVGDLQVLLSE